MLKKFRDKLKKELKNKEFRAAFDEEEIYSTIAIQIAKLRQQEHLTQHELAKKLQTTQQTISRLEDVHNNGYTIKTLIKIAQELHKKLKIQFV
ncbi:multiprotein-bridging factor 1 family protein [Candidatus Omnitrophota bacterium]